ncbi:hypothetical protein RN001_012764 [Aquatica leii]|uniref:Protein aurora borealis n=1 Tax=Aquatica leii TaxID=1421715 RepID=A0AAN7P4D4_9COLE|nr:hypothetical protein RN001_012764 [Aquatica leii]
MESKSNMEKVTPIKPIHNILLERTAQNKYYSYNSDSPFRLLPSISTPPSRIFKVKNPFESNLTERLHRSVFSPSVFNVQTSKTEEKFKWTIEDISLLKPADIDEGSVGQFEGVDHDPDVELTAQARIEAYFNEKHIVPSPFNIAINNVPLLSESDKQKNFKEVVDGTAQTILSLPPVLPEHVEAVLKPFFSYTSDQQQDENNRNSLYRKLFECGDEHSSDSVLTSPAPSCTLSPIEFSPYTESKRHSFGSCGSPRVNRMAECNLSPISSNTNEARTDSPIHLHFSEHMSVDTSLNMVPDNLDQLPSNNQSLAFESIHLPPEELLSISDVNWDLEYNHVSLATSRGEDSESEMDVSNSNTPKSKIFMSQRKKLSDTFLRRLEPDEDKENVFNILSLERRNFNSNDTTDVGYHTGTGLHFSEGSRSSTHLYASTPTRTKK